MKALRLIMCCVISFTISSAYARMYQWVDPATKITQFSGKPPVWYRSDDGGPRVIVFENNRVIDDTNIRVSEVEQQRLRHEAFLRAETNREIAREKLLQAKRLEAISKQQEGSQEPSQAVTATSQGLAEKSAEETPAVKVPAQGQITDEVVVDQMRKMIQEWEQKRAASARAMIAPQTPPSP